MSTSRVEIATRYRCRIAPDSHWLEEIAALIRRNHATTYFRGELETGTAPQIRFEFEDQEPWAAELGQKWTNLRRVTAWWSFNGQDRTLAVRAGLTLDLESEQLELRAAALSESAAQTLVSEILTPLQSNLVSSPEAMPLLYGAKRRFFTKETLSREWFAAAVEFIDSYVGKIIYFDGRFKLKSSPFQDLSRKEVQAWKESVVDNWSNVTNTDATFSGSPRRITFTCDTRRELIDLEIQVPSFGEAEELFNRLMEEWQLMPMEGEPYRYRKFARFFQVKDWKNGYAYSEAVRQAVSAAFPRDPVVVDAYIEEGLGSMDLIPFRDEDQFARQLREKGDLVQVAKLSLEGTKGSALGIYLNRASKRFELRSSLDRKTFNKVSDIFENAMDLKILKEETGRNAASDKTEPLRSKLAVAAVPVAGVLLTLLASAAMIEVYKESRERYSIEIAYPLKDQDKKPIQLTSNVTRVEWVIKKTKWWDTTEERDKPALVEIFDRSGNKLSLSGTPGGIAVNLKPGVSDIRVTSETLHKSDIVSVTAPALNDRGLF